MNVLEFFLHLYAFVIVCDFLVINPLSFPDLTSSNIFMCNLLKSLSAPILPQTVLSRIKAPQLYACCAQLYSIRAIWRAFDIVWIPTKWNWVLVKAGGFTVLLGPWSFLNKLRTHRRGHLASDQHNTLFNRLLTWCWMVCMLLSCIAWFLAFSMSWNKY